MQANRGVDPLIEWQPFNRATRLHKSGAREGLLILLGKTGEQGQSFPREGVGARAGPKAK